MVSFGGGNQICVTGKSAEHQMSGRNGHTDPLIHIVTRHPKLRIRVFGELLAKALLAKFVIRLILTIPKKNSYWFH